jgi:hypothetical protein
MRESTAIIVAAIATPVIGVVLPILYKRWQRRRPVVLRAKREAAVARWWELASRLTAELGTMSAGADRLVAAQDMLAELQATAHSELHPAFGRGSVLACAERHIRELMKIALDIADEASRAPNIDEARRAWQRLVELNSNGIDVARWNVFDAEFKAWESQPDRDLARPASPGDARVHLRNLVQQHRGHPLDCELLPERVDDPAG